MNGFVPCAPRPVYCVIESEHRSLKVADELAQGRFSIRGITLDLGIEPDWIGAEVAADREWRLEWCTFSYGLDLAFAFQRTGDLRYLRTWERLVDSWIAQVPAGSETTDAIGCRLQNWIYAWTRFSHESAERVSGATAARLLESLSAQVAHLRAALTADRDHPTPELYALLVAALALPLLDPDAAIREFAVSELLRNLHHDILPDGVHRHASTHYHLLALQSFLGLWENARRFSIALPDTVRPRLEHACDFAAHCHRPDGHISALSDSDSGRYAEVLRLAARLFDRRDWLYVASAGRSGTAPQSTARSFEVGGYFIQRSGWGDGEKSFAHERYLIFDCGPLGDGLNVHYDMLNVEIAADGQPLIVDPGRYAYPAGEGGARWRRWFEGTAAHNTVTVDGLDQAWYQPGRPETPLPRAAFGGRSTHPLLDVMWGEAVSPCYDAVHQRRILFVAGEYWIIEDRLIAATPHRYDLRFHLAPDPQRRTILNRGARPFAAGPGVALVFGASHDVALEDGWVSTQYGVKEAAPVVVATERDRPTARFITLVAPLADGAPLPVMQVRTSDDAGVTMVEVERMTPGIRDLVAWTSHAERLPIESTGISARAGVMRTHANGTRQAWYADRGDDGGTRDHSGSAGW
jgi:hypothetical protein